MNNTNAKQVTFSKMVKGSMAGAPGEMEILLNGDWVASIEAEMHDVSSGMDRQYRVCAYSVDFLHVEGRDRAFLVGKGENARTVLALAKRYAAEVLTTDQTAPVCEQK